MRDPGMRARRQRGGVSAAPGSAAMAPTLHPSAVAATGEPSRRRAPETVDSGNEEQFHAVDYVVSGKSEYQFFIAFPVFFKAGMGEPVHFCFYGHSP
jgi:hypothetical protein